MRTKSRFDSISVPDVRAVLRALAHCSDPKIARDINRFLTCETGAIPTAALEAIADAANQLLLRERREYIALASSTTTQPPRLKPNLHLVPLAPSSPDP